MRSRPARATRALLAAFFATSIAAVSHIAGGGETPAIGAIALAATFSLLVTLALVGRGLSVVRMSLAVVFSQFAFHTLFSTLGGATTGSALVDGHAHAASSISLAGGEVAATSSLMWFAHVVAAIATVAVLHRGEAAFWGMGRAALRFVAVALELTATPRAEVRRVVVVVRHAASAHLVFLEGSLQHRGPPVAL